MATESLIGTKNKKGQTYTDPRHLLFEAPRESAILSGSECAKEAVKRGSFDFSVAYPITPQSEISALIGELWVEGYVGDYLRGENEFAVMGICAGAAYGGARVVTTTAGPGTCRAFENFPMWAGSRLPILAIITCRGVNQPLSIQPDNIEMGFLMDTGMLIWHATTNQELFDWTMLASQVIEEPDVHLPLALCVDGFFVTHTREKVELTPPDLCMPPYNPYRAPMVCMDMETAPVRNMRDPFVMKSNYISYMTHASWQQEVRAAIERSRKHTERLIGPLAVTIGDPEAEILFVASGTAVAQCRAAMEILEDEGLSTRLLKIKTIRPFPDAEVIEATRTAKLIVIPEFNIQGWLAREVMSRIDNSSRVLAGPRVFGGMTLPPEVIVEEVQKVVKMHKEVLA